MSKIFVVAVLLLMGLPAIAAEKMTMAVMDFEARDVPRSDAIKISELIRTELIDVNEYILVERAQVDKILKEQGFQMSGCTDVSCAVQIGKLLSAKKILVGSVMKIGDSITIAGRVVDVQKGIGEFGEKVTVKSKDDLVYGVEQFCRKLSAQITGKPIEKKQAFSKKSHIIYYSSRSSSYDAESDPTGWISLGTFLAGGVICAGGAISYKFKTDSIRSQIDGSSFMLTGTLGRFDPAISLYFVRDIQNKKKDIRDAARTRNTIYYIGGGFGGLAAVMFFTFIGRYIYNSAAANMTPESEHFALYIKVPNYNVIGRNYKDDCSFSVGLSSSW